MIIVNQDKTRITEDMEFYIEKQPLGKKYLILSHDAFWGIYETKERAKEVLEEIMATYIRTEQYKIEDEMTRMRIFAKGIFAYEMPAE